jgi:hypothetical protein
MNKSFLSIVADLDNPDNLLVRARIRGDIERLFPEADVIHTPDLIITTAHRFPGKQLRRVLNKAWRISLLEF